MSTPTAPDALPARPAPETPAPAAASAAGTPGLTVVLPAFDAEATLGAQLAALHAQERSFDWEVLVCDNGSTDGTRDVVGAWATRLPGLRLVDASRRRGAAAARNVGIEHARAERIAFCDADDVVGAGWAQAMHDALVLHPFVAGRLDGTMLNDARTLRSREVPQSDELKTSWLVPGAVHAGAGNLGIRRSVLDHVGGFCEAAPALEDTDLCWRVQLAGFPLVRAPQALVHVRLRDGVRTAYGQGSAYGRGERWLERRFTDGPFAEAVRARVAEVAPAPSAVEEAPEDADARPRGAADHTSGLAAVLGELRAAAGRGALALAWTVGWELALHAEGVVGRDTVGPGACTCCPAPGSRYAVPRRRRALS